MQQSGSTLRVRLLLTGSGIGGLTVSLYDSWLRRSTTVSTALSRASPSVMTSWRIAWSPHTSQERDPARCYGTLGPSIVAPPCSRLTLLAFPAPIVNVNRNAGSNATPNA